MFKTLFNSIGFTIKYSAPNVDAFVINFSFVNAEKTTIWSEGGRILDISEVGCAEGTTVVVENLFFNVPA